MTWSFLALIWAHWLGDFVLQTDRMATRKSSDNEALLSHVLTYGTALCAPSLLLLSGWRWVLFVVLNVVAHGATDYVTSRITSRLWAAGKRHEFFVVIGLDQALHMTALALTFWWLS